MKSLRSTKPADIQDFIARNDPSLLRPTASESLSLYQQVNGGVGTNVAEIERSWLRATGYNTWENLVQSLSYFAGTLRESIRNFFRQFTGNQPDPTFFLLENGNFFLLENGDKQILG